MIEEKEAIALKIFHQLRTLEVFLRNMNENDFLRRGEPITADIQDSMIGLQTSVAGLAEKTLALTSWKECACSIHDEAKPSNKEEAGHE